MGTKDYSLWSLVLCVSPTSTGLCADTCPGTWAIWGPDVTLVRLEQGGGEIWMGTGQGMETLDVWGGPTVQHGWMGGEMRARSWEGE